MQTNSAILISIVISIALGIAAIFLWLKMLNSKDGERYIKQRMQGPFVPEPRSENAEDLATHQDRTAEKSMNFTDVAESLKQRGKI